MDIKQLDQESSAVITAAMEVHGELGPGFRPEVYREAMAIECTRRGIPFQQDCPLPIFYKNMQLATHGQTDFLCFGKLIVEIKAQPSISSQEEAIAMFNLKASNCARSLLLNFGGPRLQFKPLFLPSRP